MRPGIRKGLEDIAWELKGIKNILASIWHSRYENNSTDVLNPQAFADEYISTEECSRRPVSYTHLTLPTKRIV